MKKINKKIFIPTIAILSVILIIFILVKINNKIDENTPQTEIEMSNINAQKTIDKTEDLDFGNLTSNNDDESVLFVTSKKAKEKVIVNIRESSITKEKGIASDHNKQNTIGLNSALVASTNTAVKIYNSKITTNSNNSNTIFVGGLASSSLITDTQLFTTKQNSNGIVVGNQGYVEAENIILRTDSANSSALLTSTEDASMTIKNSNLETMNVNSPIINSNGDIKLINTTGTTYESNFANIYKGLVSLDGSTIIVSAKDDTNGPNCFFINGNNGLNIMKSSLNINNKLSYYNKATLFLLKDSTTTINISETQINLGSNKIIKLEKSNLTFNLNNQDIKGNIEMDSSSELTLSLKNNSTYSGKINSSQNNKVKLHIDNSSTITLTENTYITELTNDNKTNSNINFNGYKLYINNKSIN